MTQPDIIIQLSLAAQVLILVLLELLILCYKHVKTQNMLQISG